MLRVVGLGVSYLVMLLVLTLPTPQMHLLFCDVSHKIDDCGMSVIFRNNLNDKKVNGGCMYSFNYLNIILYMYYHHCDVLYLEVAYSAIYNELRIYPCCWQNVSNFFITYLCL